MTFSLKSARIPFFSAVFRKNSITLGREGAVLPSLRRDEEERTVMLGSLGALYTLGYAVDWSRIYPAGGGAFDSRSIRGSASVVGLRRGGGQTGSHIGARRPVNGTGKHPLLGRHFKSAPSCGNPLLGSRTGPECPALSG